MKYDKIMAGDNLENVVGRLIYCSALLDVLIGAMDDDRMVDPLSGVHDLLEVICRDFQTNIDAAEEYTGNNVRQAFLMRLVLGL